MSRARNYSLGRALLTFLLFAVLAPARAQNVPTSPSNLKVIAATADSLTFTFRDNSTNETSFTFQVTNDLTGLPIYATVDKNLGSNVDVTRTVGGLSPSTAYSCRVRADKSNTPSPYSNVAHGTTTAAPLPSLTALSLSLSTTTGGTGAIGTVTLSQGAPSGGAAVGLSSNMPGVASVPPNVTIPATQTSTTFPITTYPVATQTSVVITATYGGSQMASLTVNPPVVTSLSLSPNTLRGGNASTATVTLSGPAPVGAALSLATTNSAAILPPGGATVPANQTTTTFQVGTSPVGSVTTGDVSASYGGGTGLAALTVNPPKVTSLVLSPNTVLGGGSSTATVTLDGPVPPAGGTLSLHNTNSAALMPGALVSVPGGLASTTFPVGSTAVAVVTTGIIYASFGDGTGSAMLTVNPPVVSALSLSQSNVMGGLSVTGTVTLNGPAPSGGALVTLASTNAAASVPPGGVTVPFNQTSANFTVTTIAVGAATNGNITATLNGVLKSAPLTVAPAQVVSLILSPNSVTGGSSSTGTVTLNGPAPATGATLTLGSTNAAAVLPVAPVTVPGGLTSTTFTVGSTAVAGITIGNITASFGGGTGTAAFTVNPPQVTGLTLVPSSITGGSSSTATATLNGPAPAVGATLVLGSTNSAAILPGAPVTVTAGQTTKTFTVGSSAVGVVTVGNITASYGGGTGSAALTINPPVLTSFTVSPTTVKYPAGATGTVTINALAPSGGIPVALVSGNPAAAAVPAIGYVIVPGGLTSTTFPITTGPVQSPTPVLLTAGLGVALSATLNVQDNIAPLFTFTPTTVIGSGGFPVNAVIGDVLDLSGIKSITISGCKPPLPPTDCSGNAQVGGFALPLTWNFPAPGLSGSTTTFSFLVQPINPFVQAQFNYSGLDWVGNAVDPWVAMAERGNGPPPSMQGIIYADDTLLEITNDGVQNATLTLGSQQFQIRAYQGPVGRVGDTFHIPEKGRVVLDIGAFVPQVAGPIPVTLELNGPAGGWAAFVFRVR